ncbi:PQ-loop-domain-containing protein [Athelia psychrophila]|uniref:PQ-loop-domain-containing protein n=1 Tax=Athelia psychrophila TaxID=1759441 RepID=A0A166UAF2_9AGAM|nr:PQ-loop-domain-containing protein [Fibularhizoctonia sp. CBS 109695]
MLIDGDKMLSTILGGISIGCWIVVYSPQILENYQLQSGEGLSVFFVIIWLLGDLCNLGGALLAGLLPTVIILALYYSICDIILLIQIYYYRWARSLRTEPNSITAERDTEETPLLVGSTPECTHETGSQRLLKLYAPYAAAVLFVIASGVFSWWISLRSGNGKGAPQSPSELETSEWTIQLIGWSSAVLYLGSRIPQIFKNFKTKCEGLSPALFLFAIAGNVTYALSICAASMEREYLVRNGSWLAGSALTVFLDIFVLCQFFYYRSSGSRESEEILGGES